MADTPATVNIPRDVLEPIIQANIAVAVSTALGSNDDLVRQAVAGVLNGKVDREGKPTNSSWETTTFIQWVMREAVIRATKQVLETEMVKYQDKIKEMLAAEFKKSRSPIVKQLIEGMTGAMTNPDVLKYRLKVEYDSK